MTQWSYYNPDHEDADINGDVTFIAALIKGEEIYVPKKQKWCYRHEIAAYNEMERNKGPQFTITTSISDPNVVTITTSTDRSLF